MASEAFLVYCYGQDGRCQKPEVVRGFREAAERAAVMAPKSPEIRVCDMLDQLVFHVVGGKIVYPNGKAQQTGANQTNARPFVVFAVQDPLPGGSDFPELSLPFAHTSDVEEAVSLVAEANKDNPDYVVVDAMDYDRLMELADMLEEEDPSYPEGAKAGRRPLDFGWAIRRLEKGEKVRFGTWDPGRYIVRLGNGNVVDHSGVPWQPYRTEIMSPRWEVCR